MTYRELTYSNTEAPGCRYLIYTVSPQNYFLIYEEFEKLEIVKGY